MRNWQWIDLLSYWRKMMPNDSPQAQPPERIWIDNGAGVWQVIGSRTLPDPPQNMRVEYVRADLPRAAADAGLSVEAALAELREMFPNDSPCVQVFVWFRPDGYRASIYQHGRSLDEAMQQV